MQLRNEVERVKYKPHDAAEAESDFWVQVNKKRDGRE